MPTSRSSVSETQTRARLNSLRHTPCLLGLAQLYIVFNRVAESLETFLAEIFGIPSARYFNDFTFGLPNALADIVAGAAKNMFLAIFLDADGRASGECSSSCA